MSQYSSQNLKVLLIGDPSYQSDQVVTVVTVVGWVLQEPPKKTYFLAYTEERTN